MDQPRNYNPQFVVAPNFHHAVGKGWLTTAFWGTQHFQTKPDRLLRWSIRNLLHWVWNLEHIWNERNILSIMTHENTWGNDRQCPGFEHSHRWNQHFHHEMFKFESVSFGTPNVINHTIPFTQWNPYLKTLVKLITYYILDCILLLSLPPLWHPMTSFDHLWSLKRGPLLPGAQAAGALGQGRPWRCWKPREKYERHRRQWRQQNPSPLATGLYPQIRWYSRGLSFIAINVTLAILGIRCEKKHLNFWTNEMAAMSTDHWNAAKQTAMQSMRPNYCNPCRPVFRLGSQIKPIWCSRFPGLWWSLRSSCHVMPSLWASIWSQESSMETRYEERPRDRWIAWPMFKLKMDMFSVEAFEGWNSS